MKRMTILIPVMNNMRFSMPMLGCLKYNTSPDTEWLVVDNGSTEPVEQYIRNYIKPKKLNFIRFEENIGLMETNKLAYETCLETGSDILMLLHTDCFIFEKDWDKRIISYFDSITNLGIAGFFGAQGCMPNGGRVQDAVYVGQMAGLSNMLEAEIHGQRMKEPYRACAIYDSFAMCLSMAMLKKGGGFDMRYKWHHMYDRDISLESLRRGFKNIVVDVPCHHIGGLTGESAQYQSWLETKIGSKFEDGKFHNENTIKFEEKWKEVLPLYVEDDFSFRTGQAGYSGLTYKGDIITKMSLEGGDIKMNDEDKKEEVDQNLPIEEIVPGGTEVVEDQPAPVEPEVVVVPEVPSDPGSVVEEEVKEPVVPEVPVAPEIPGRATLDGRNPDGSEKAGI